NRNIGKVLTKHSKVFSFGDEETVRTGNEDRVFRWRKRYFVHQHSALHYTPDASDFIRYVTDEGGVFNTSLIDSTTGYLFDENLAQWTNAAYSIEIWRKNPTSVQ